MILVLLCTGQWMAGIAQHQNAHFTAFEEETFKNSFEEVKQNYFLAPDNEINAGKLSTIDQKLESVEEWLLKKKEKAGSDRVFLRQLFYTVHRKLLKNYEEHSLVTETLSNGKYDCVSGTAVYGLLLEEMGYQFKIRELNYHIFLEIETAEGPLVIESTDPLNGFDKPARDVEEILRLNQQDNEAFRFASHVDNYIGLKELAGLQYYNLAVKHYNTQNFSDAWSAVSKALMLYNSPRVWEIHKLITLYASGTDVAFVQED